MCGTHFFRACAPLCYIAKVYSLPYIATRGTFSHMVSEKLRF